MSQLDRRFADVSSGAAAGQHVPLGDGVHLDEPYDHESERDDDDHEEKDPDPPWLGVLWRGNGVVVLARWLVSHAHLTCSRTINVR